MNNNPNALGLTSPAFSEGFAVPQDYTADGRNVSPPLAWRDPPDGTVSFFYKFNGLEQRLKLPDGRVLARDVGPITFTQTFDADGNLVSSDAGDLSGRHDLFDVGGYCSILIPALS